MGRAENRSESKWSRGYPKACAKGVAKEG
ncbi:uncharacterized protein FFMR_01578 [Fusarium fujikuroi]|nr:uncharacterized protein FFMR_01578 [Fusarium fujikuroi]